MDDPGRQRIIFERAYKFLIQIAKWSEIHNYLLSNGYEPETENRESQIKRHLVDQDTAIIAILVYLRSFKERNNFYTISSLAEATDNSSYKARKARERKIKRTLEKIEGYQIIKFQEGFHEGKRKCIKIEATNLLIDFIENHFFSEEGD